jgi:GT2 family glycosyltransferase
MAVHHTPEPWLDAAIASVRSQTYPHWELCLALDDAAQSASLWAKLQILESPQIRITRLDTPSGISRTLNAAATLATGDFIGVLDHDDLLHPHCLAHCATADADLIYTDEDYLSPDGTRHQPSFKPGWSPTLLLSCMYLGHFWIARRHLVERAGWFRPDFDGAQDHDLVLRLTRDPAVTVAHIPEVLYHWRQHPASTASSSRAKPYAHDAGRRAVAAATQLQVLDGPRTHTYAPQWPNRLTPTLIICSRNGRLLNQCLTQAAPALRALDGQILVVHHVLGPHTGVAEVCEQHNARRIEFAEPFHFARMNNRAARLATTDALVFLNDDVTARDDRWLNALLGQISRPEVAIAGARLLYPDGTLQHAGIALGIGELTGHIGRFTVDSPLWHWLHLAREVSAVTGACLAIRRDTFLQLQGFDESFPVNYNDTDLCLRARQLGLSVVFEPQATLTHAESQSRAAGTTYPERAAFSRKWPTLQEAFYSRNLQPTEQILLNPNGIF